MNFDISDTTLESGLQIYHCKVLRDDVSVMAQINTGPLYEDPDTAGISHLVEHMLFKGTDKRPNRDIIYGELGELGGTDRTCYTSKTEIILQQRFVKEDFEKGLDLFSDLLFESLIREKELEDEKNIVIDEIRQRHDKPALFTNELFFDHLFHHLPIGKSPGGTLESVSSISPKKARVHYDMYFNPSNLILFTSSPYDLNYVVELVEANFPNKEGADFWVDDIEIPPSDAQFISSGKSLKNAHLRMGRILSDAKKDKFALSVLGPIFGRVVQERIRNKENLSYSVNTVYDYNRFFDLLIGNATCAPENVDKTITIMKEEWEKVRAGDFPDHYFESVKQRKRKSFILGMSTTMHYASFMKICKKEDNDVYEMCDYLESLDAVTLEDVRRVGSEHISTDDLTIVVHGVE